jgi:hypothetical protein
MKADFSGWATKAGLRCSDGRTIMPDAFKHQDTMQVPLVWQHDHKNLENVLGHVLLTNKKEGVWCDAFFNDTDKAKIAKALVEHKDINSLSIWANELVERSKKVLHGAIREVSLVLSGANPGALIQNIQIRHGDDIDELEDEAIIYTGLEFELAHADDGGDDDEEDDRTVKDVYDTLNDDQKAVVNYMIGQALEKAGVGGDDAKHSDLELDVDDENSVTEVYESLSDGQKQLVHYMIGEAITAAEIKNGINPDDPKGNEMKHNVFEQGENGAAAQAPTISREDMKGILEHAQKEGSLKSAVVAYVEAHPDDLKHGIEDIDILFPEARAIATTPELFGRRTEWVNDLLSGVRKSPFSRIKTLYADITAPEARAKGYIKGSLKKEEFFKVARRVTTPTTIYKKQKLDRDDILDITDFDVVVWLKGEMRLMLDEELARAILVGDGRDGADADKIDEEKIRPIASDHELYTTTVNVNIGDTNSSFNEVVDAITRNRKELRGTGLPTMYTTETYIAQAMTTRDTLGRRIYRSLDDLSTELRVSKIVPVEILEEYPDIVAVLVNPVDYVVGADRGGNVSMFDDFDIDYNQQKYLIETRCSGALVKLKAAMVVKKTAGANAVVVPAEPAFDGDEITITDQTGVVYRNADTDAVMNAAGSPYAVADGVTVTVNAEPAAGYYFESSEDDSWSFTGTV